MPSSDPVSLALQALAERRNLVTDEAEAAFSQVMGGEASPVQMAALLMGLRAKGETAQEVAGAVRALRGAMLRVEPGAGGPVVDTCGTGGGRVTTFNISTAAAIVVAACGVRVAKHGNRSFTSRSGSADLLEALGVRLADGPEAAGRQLARCGMAFLFAPNFHPAMKHVGPVRRELGITTMMNLLGPLANPANVSRQVVGVADADRALLVAEALAALGAEHALVVHALEGMDEISPNGPTDVWEVRHGAVNSWRLDPAPLGLASGSSADLAGGSPADNAVIVRSILEGRDTSARASAVLLNGAAALLVAGTVRDWKEGVSATRQAVASGRASAFLDSLAREPAV